MPFHFGQWSDPEYPPLKWCGRCQERLAPHTHLNSRRTDREAKLQVIWSGVP
jgi:hypothetical protein